MTASPRYLEEENSLLRAENAALRGAVSLLHRIANLVRESTELESTGYALLTGVTAGVGLGMNRAMLFYVDGIGRNLTGVAAVGPADREEANRVWKSIESEAPDLQTLYAAGLHQRDNPGRLDRIVKTLRVPIDGHSPISLAMKRGEPVYSEGSDDLDGLLSLPTAIAAPMRGRETLRGVLFADNWFNEIPPDPVVRQIFALVADHAGRAIENAQRFEDIAKAARTDALTGLPHHGAMWECLSISHRASRREGSPLSIAMLDLDDFKKINDTLGHLAGDALLAGVAERLGGELRDEARVFRYGGEEFVIIATRCDGNTIASIGERVRRAIAERPFAIGDGKSAGVTCSVGVSTLFDSECNERSLVLAADTALLAAKANGKNCVEKAPSSVR